MIMNDQLFNQEFIGKLASEVYNESLQLPSTSMDNLAGNSMISPQININNHNIPNISENILKDLESLNDLFKEDLFFCKNQTCDSSENNQYYFLRDKKAVNSKNSLQKVVKDMEIQNIRKDFPMLSRQVYGKPLVWLDNAATTQKPQKVIDAIVNYYKNCNSNVHRGAHKMAELSTNAYEESREKIKTFIGAKSSKEIIFTRGATEAINLVAQTYGRKNIGYGDEIIVSTLEHHSNIVPWQLLCKEKGAVLKVIPINDSGELILEEYEKLFSERTKLVAVGQVSNALGTINPVNIIASIAHNHGVPVVVDGAQGIPHIKSNVQLMDADFYVFSGHKLFAPTGIGVLYGKEKLLEEMPPWQGGGNMIDEVSFDNTTFNGLPNKFEAGTGNIADAVGLGAAIDYINEIGWDNMLAYEHSLMIYAQEALSSVPNLRQIGAADKKAGILSFVVPGIETEKIGSFLDKEGIAVRAGHHCAQPSLRYFGLTSTVRPSIAFYNTFEEIDLMVAALYKAVKSL